MPRKKRNNGSSNVTPQVLEQALRNLSLARAPAKRKRKRSRRGGGGAGGIADGEIRISRKELLTTVTLPRSKPDVNGYVKLEPGAFSFLKGVSKSFERYKYQKLRVYWKPAVGTVYGGMVAMGIDFDSSRTAGVGRSQVVAYTPSMTCACWADTESKPLIIPPPRLQTRNWYLTSATGFDASPGTLMWAANGESSATADKVLGEIWVEYSITFQGTQSA